MTLDILPPLPDVTIFPTVALPVTFNVPAILAPVPVTTNVVLPAAVRLTLPLTVGILTLLVPLHKKFFYEFFFFKNLCLLIMDDTQSSGNTPAYIIQG